ncbi:MAG: hypothetical protein KKA32_08820 [Actinobacteria bacterium]|nr:hypothetical protein [Actinomycetota bacterium]
MARKSTTTRGILVVLNNFLHDLATGTWVAANAFQWGVLRWRHGGHGPVDPETAAGLRAVRTAGRVSLLWIVGGGVVRALTFRRYEWSDAAGRGQLGLLGVKHMLLFGAVAAGRRLERQVAAAQEPERGTESRG